MERKYDSRTTIFSPEGRLYQVEYAMETISNAGLAIGILAIDGIVLTAERKVTSKLLDHRSEGEKIHKICESTCCAVAGFTSDANTLTNYSRYYAQKYLLNYGEPVPVEQLVRRLSDAKQAYTQFGGLRPYGVSFLFAGYDKHYGFQLYQSDPSGNYSGWKATSIGANSSNVQSILKQEYKEDINVEGAKKLAVKILAKATDSNALNAYKIEFCTVKLSSEGVMECQLYDSDQINDLLKAEGVYKMSLDPNEGF